MAKIRIKKTNDPDADNLLIKDTRTVDGITGKALNDKNRLDRTADLGVMRKIIQAANKYGVDPYTALAMAHQETGLKSEGDTEGNPFHLLDNTPDDLIDAGVKTIRDKMAYGRSLGKKSEADLIQAFNGYGKVGANTEGHQKSLYGIDVTNAPINMNANPVYGKRILDIRDNILKRNPDVVKLVQSQSQPAQQAPVYQNANFLGLPPN